MGIKNLNRYLRDKCSKNAIYKAKLSTFENKTLVIDTSIYLYQFIGENALLENILHGSLFRCRPIIRRH